MESLITILPTGVDAIQADYHMHTVRCRHAQGTMREYVETALAAGLRQIGFSDHCPLPRGLGKEVRMAESELKEYVEDVLALREEYRGRLDILLGLEMDFVPGLEDFTRDIQGSHPWDYIIGSIHYLDLDCRESCIPKVFTGDPIDLYTRYFRLMIGLADSGLYDMTGHFDFPRRSGTPIPEAARPLVREALKAVAAAGMVLELNTSGFRHETEGLPQPYPSFDIVEEALDLGIPLTVNSDSHDPAHVAWEFPRMREALLARGCRDLSHFRLRKRMAYRL